MEADACDNRVTSDRERISLQVACCTVLSCYARSTGLECLVTVQLRRDQKNKEFVDGETTQNGGS